MNNQSSYDKNKETLYNLLKGKNKRRKRKIWKMLEESKSENVIWFRLGMFVEYFWNSATQKEKYNHLINVNSRLVKEGKAKRLKDTIGDDGRIYRNYQDLTAKGVEAISSFPVIKP